MKDDDIDIDSLMTYALSKDWNKPKDISAQEVGIFLVKLAQQYTNLETKTISSEYDNIVNKKIFDSFGDELLNLQNNQRLQSIENERIEYLHKNMNTITKTIRKGKQLREGDTFYVDNNIVEARYWDIYKILEPYAEYFLPLPNNTMPYNPKRDLYHMQQAQYIRSIIFRYESNLSEERNKDKILREKAKRQKALINLSYEPLKNEIIENLIKMGANKQKASYTATKTIKLIKQLIK